MTVPACGIQICSKETCKGERCDVCSNVDELAGFEPLNCPVDQLEEEVRGWKLAADELLLTNHHWVEYYDKAESTVAQMQEALEMWLRLETELEPQSLTMQRERRQKLIALTKTALAVGSTEYHNPKDLAYIREMEEFIKEHNERADKLFPPYE